MQKGQRLAATVKNIGELADMFRKLSDILIANPHQVSISISTDIVYVKDKQDKHNVRKVIS